MEASLGIYSNGLDYTLLISAADDRTRTLFEEFGLQGGGYTWEGIVTALVAMHMPGALESLSIDPEADNLPIDCKNRETLERIEVLVRAAMKDHSILQAAIERAGDDLE